MKTIRLAMLGTALALCSVSVSAQQTLTFDNTSPQITLPLTSASTFTFDDNGNVHATCQLGPDNRCTGMPASTCPVPPGVSILADTFSNPPIAGNQYPPGTTFSIYPTVTNADLCVRETTAGTPAGTGWTGIATTSLGSPFVALLPEGAGTYGFKLTCYGASGRQTSNTITLTTSEGTGGGDQCVPGTPVGAAGFSRYLPYDEITDIPLVPSNTVYLQPFPNTGGQMGRLVIPKANWVALRFTVPADPNALVGLARQFYFQESQVGGAASLNRTYISVSQCAGDFRSPPAGNAPSGDPTYARGCRNLRASPSTVIQYDGVTNATASTDIKCKLTLGGTYYFNMILANPNDGGGIQPGETTCTNPDATQCGIQFRAE